MFQEGDVCLRDIHQSRMPNDKLLHMALRAVDSKTFNQSDALLSSMEEFFKHFNFTRFLAKKDMPQILSADVSIGLHEVEVS
jgi:hypothetical protein